MAANLPGPKFIQLFDPVIWALKTLGGSARPAEVRDQVAADLDISDQERSVLLDGGEPRFNNLVAWARFYLVKAGYIDSSRRGVWTLTDKGRSLPGLTHDQSFNLFKTVHAEFPRARKGEEIPESEAEEATSPPDQAGASNSDYQQDLLETLMGLPPDGFERFCQRLLRESGFQEVTVTGRAGDGGIDGIGILQVNPLVVSRFCFSASATRAPSPLLKFVTFEAQ